MRFDIKSSDIRPWWWWINPWLYIKRRDIAYDECLEIIYELGVELDARPKAKGRYERDWEPKPMATTAAVKAQAGEGGGK